MNRLINILVIKIIVLIVLVGTSQTLIAADGTINSKMGEIGQTINALMPVILSEEIKLSDEKKKHTIKKIDQLIHLFGDVKPHILKKSTTYRVSYDVITDHLKQTRQAYQASETRYGGVLLRQLTTICVSCHMQDSKKRTLFSGKKRTDFKTDFQFAEYNYITRNYEVAKVFYDRYLLKSKRKISESRFLTVLNRLLVIDTQIYNRPKQAAAQLTHYMMLPQHSVYTRKTNEQWIEGLNDLSVSKFASQDITSVNQLNHLIEQYMGYENGPKVGLFKNKKQQVIRVWLRGQIFRLLNKNSSPKDTPQLLFWLAIMDRSIDYNYFYSFADLYLKECMLTFTHDAFAKKCFEEFKDYTEFSYSGSRGTSIPAEVSKELEQLKSVVYGGK